MGGLGGAHGRGCRVEPTSRGRHRVSLRSREPAGGAVSFQDAAGQACGAGRGVSRSHAYRQRHRPRRAHHVRVDPRHG